MDLIGCSYRLIDDAPNAAITVHQEPGPGRLESVCELPLMIVLRGGRIRAVRQVETHCGRGVQLSAGFRADIIFEGCPLLGLKTLEELSPIHLAQKISYLKLRGFKRGSFSTSTSHGCGKE